MNNKILVTFHVNELVWKVEKLVTKSISDIMNIEAIYTKDYILMNKDSSEIYSNNEIIINTNIRNGTELLLVAI